MKSNNLVRISGLLGLVWLGICLMSVGPRGGTKLVGEDSVLTPMVYATSTGTGSVANLFDGDSATVWEPTKGSSGAGEGITLYFEKPIYIGNVKVLSPKNSFVAEVSFLCDNSDLKRGSVGEEVRIGKLVGSLTIRILSIVNTTREFFQIQHYTASMGYGDAAGPVGLSEIVFMDDWSEEIAPVRVMRGVPGRILASTVMDPANAYHPSFLFDSRPDFGWGEGHGGNGVDETMALSFDRVVQIAQLKLWNGHQRSGADYNANARVKRMTISNEHGNKVTLDVPDRMEPSVLPLGQTLAGQNFLIKIDEVYPGASTQDLVLAEMRFHDGEGWFTMDSDGEVLLRDFLTARTKGSPVGKILDQHYAIHWYGYKGQRKVYSEGRGLQLRSNGSFVLSVSRHDESLATGQGLSQYAEGAWEAVSHSDGVSKVRLYGRVESRSRTLEGSLGAGIVVETKPLDEYIYVGEDVVRGEKLLDSLPLRIRNADWVSCGKYAGLWTDLKYKTADNFMKEMLYDDCHKCVLRNEVAKALGKADSLLQARAKGKGYKFMVWDAYRPWAVQKRMWEKYKDTLYVADPYHGGSNHNRGTAVDLTLCMDQEHLLDMGTGYDHFGVEAHHGYKKLPKAVIKNRELLRSVMEEAGFKALESEWWHYSWPVTYPIVEEEWPCGE